MGGLNRNVNEVNKADVECEVLDWYNVNQAEFLSEEETEEGFDYLLAADVLWVCELVEPFFDAIKYVAGLRQNNPNKPPYY